MSQPMGSALASGPANFVKVENLGSVDLRKYSEGYRDPLFHQRYHPPFTYVWNHTHIRIDDAVRRKHYPSLPIDTCKVKIFKRCWKFVDHLSRSSLKSISGCIYHWDLLQFFRSPDDFRPYSRMYPHVPHERISMGEWKKPLLQSNGATSRLLREHRVSKCLLVDLF